MKPTIAFFGTPSFAVTILDALEARGFLPSVIITQEDKPQGRHLVITPPPVKVWAEKRGIPVLQPLSLKNPEFASVLAGFNCDLFIVASYGKIIPSNILELPKYKTLNVHPSLLPKLRGSSPIQGAILTEDTTGVSIMRLDEEMDHGPIIAQKEVAFDEWPPYAPVLEETLAQEGGALLAEVIPGWIDGTISEQEQDHAQATYTKKVAKEDARIDLSGNPEENLRKVRAYAGWPGAFTFLETKKGVMRVIIKAAHLEEGVLVLDRVIPEGRKEMGFEEFKRGFF